MTLSEKTPPHAAMQGQQFGYFWHTGSDNTSKRERCEIAQCTYSATLNAPTFSAHPFSIVFSLSTPPHPQAISFPKPPLFLGPQNYCLQWRRGNLQWLGCGDGPGRGRPTVKKELPLKMARKKRWVQEWVSNPLHAQWPASSQEYWVTGKYAWEAIQLFEYWHNFSKWKRNPPWVEFGKHNLPCTPWTFAVDVRMHLLLHGYPRTTGLLTNLQTTKTQCSS